MTKTQKINVKNKTPLKKNNITDKPLKKGAKKEALKKGTKNKLVK